MPLTIPSIDDRRYADLVADALARIPVHTPEWTNFNRSDPGVTLVEVFAFLTESLLYRANQIPERNRRKFLQLLGIPLRAASSAHGVVTFSNDRGPLETITLNDGLEVLAGRVPFRTDAGLDVLPVDARVFYKRKLENPSPELEDYYRHLYASYLKRDPPPEFTLYETVPLDAGAVTGVDVQSTVGSSLWIALLLRKGDAAPPEREEAFAAARRALARKTASIGFVPALYRTVVGAGGLEFVEGARARIGGPPPGPEAAARHLDFQLPEVPANGDLPADGLPRYRTLPSRARADVLERPGVVEVTLPDEDDLRTWTGVDPLEAGVGDLPPALEDTQLADRLITWIRVRVSAGAQARMLWAGLNATPVEQRTRVANEVLPAATGEPDQVIRLARAPVLPGSVRLTVTTASRAREWREIDDLDAAAPEVPLPDALPADEEGAPRHVFELDPESGELRFGDGERGERPPRGATMRASYDVSEGRAGNVGPGAISAAPGLPAGLKVTNPVRTWGGAAAETVAEGEKQIARHLKHRDRLVSTEDFETITRRTPGVDVARVEVVPAYNPELGTTEPGDSAGAVTLMVIPSFDPVQPDAPQPDRLFLESICRFLEPRRLVTTEVFVRGPSYVPVWVSAGIDVVADESAAEVREAVKRALLGFLDPLGWPLRKAIVALELQAVATRVPGVRFVNELRAARGTEPESPSIELVALQLPRVLGISVAVGSAPPLDQVRGLRPDEPGGGDGPGGPGDPGGPGGPGDPGAAPRFVPVPVVPETC
jgi:Baseplate J-like protein